MRVSKLVLSHTNTDTNTDTDKDSNTETKKRQKQINVRKREVSWPPVHQLKALSQHSICTV